MILTDKVLSEVLGLRAVVRYIRNNELYYSFDCIGERRESSINIFEFGDKCKEWLKNNTYWDLMIVGYEVYLMEDIFGEGGARTHKRFTKQREWYSNIFAACEYIMESKENK